MSQTHPTTLKGKTMKLAELKIETLAAARTMTREEVEAWIAREENTTIRLILWEAINA